MPDFDHIAANAQGSSVVSGVSIAPAGDRMGDFALSFEGYIRIPSDGVYELSLQAHDCARLYVDGRLAAESMNPPAREAFKSSCAPGYLRLAAGYHSVRIEYAEIGGGSPSLSLDGDWSFYCN